MQRLFAKLILLLLPAVLLPVGVALLLGANYWPLALLIAAGCVVAAGLVIQKSISRAELQRSEPLRQFVGKIAAGDLTARIGNDQPENNDSWNEIALGLDAAAEHLQQQMAELESSRSELQAVMDSMQEAVAAVDASGRIQWTNEVMQRVTGGAVRLGQTLVHTVRDPELLLCVRNTLESRVISTAKASTISPGRMFEASAAPTPGGGAVVVLHDITQVERSDITRRDFIANVSHELRTPLTSISGYVETLLDANESLDKHAREFLNIILKNATRMNRLTEDLLALARVESGEHKLHPHPMPAVILMEDAVHSLRGLAEDLGVELQRGPLTQAKVLADSDAIQQVLTNLIENAIKYGQSGGKVLISAKEIGGDEFEEMVEFSVRDYGPGIAYVHQARIFERFYRVDKARSKESGGTGLGLAIAKHIVQAHGGSIRVESELNMGSNFIFTLPTALNSHHIQADVTKL
jgi:two-component system phosphate regulon sensor histidine kinase PhoR